MVVRISHIRQAFRLAAVSIGATALLTFSSLFAGKAHAAPDAASPDSQKISAPDSSASASAPILVQKGDNLAEIMEKAGLSEKDRQAVMSQLVGKNKKAQKLARAARGLQPGDHVHILTAPDGAATGLVVFRDGKNSDVLRIGIKGGSTLSPASENVASATPAAPLSAPEPEKAPDLTVEPAGPASVPASPSPPAPSISGDASAMPLSLAVAAQTVTAPQKAPSITNQMKKTGKDIGKNEKRSVSKTDVKKKAPEKKKENKKENKKNGTAPKPAPKTDVPTFTLKAGEGPETLLKRAVEQIQGLTPAAQAAIASAFGQAQTRGDAPRRAKAGMRVRLEKNGTITFISEVERGQALGVKIEKRADGRYDCTAFGAAPALSPRALNGVVYKSFAKLAAAKGLSDKTVKELAEIMTSPADPARGVDLSQMQSGDIAKVLWDDEIGGDGQPTGRQIVRYAEFMVGGKSFTALRANVPGLPEGFEGYFDAEGKPLTKLARDPMNGAEVTSPFGLRNHPIRKRIIHHNGVDFAARGDNSIFASMGGVILDAGFAGGYGYVVDVAAPNPKGGLPIVFRHAHCKVPGKGSIGPKPGEIVRPGQKIAEQGSTGLSTGPHLHYEVRIPVRLKNGQMAYVPVNMYETTHNAKGHADSHGYGVMLAETRADLDKQMVAEREDEQKKIRLAALAGSVEVSGAMASSAPHAAVVVDGRAAPPAPLTGLSAGDETSGGEIKGPIKAPSESQPPGPTKPSSPKTVLRRVLESLGIG